MFQKYVSFAFGLLTLTPIYHASLYSLSDIFSRCTESGDMTYNVWPWAEGYQEVTKWIISADASILGSYVGLS